MGKVIDINEFKLNRESDMDEEIYLTDRMKELSKMHDQDVIVTMLTLIKYMAESSEDAKRSDYEDIALDVLHEIQMRLVKKITKHNYGKD